MGLIDRLSHAWNAFKQVESPPSYRAPTYVDLGYASSVRPDRMYFSKGNERSIITAIFNRIALDVASIDIKHVEVDEDENFQNVKKSSSLNELLSTSANKDQTSRAFIQDIVQSMFDEGCVAVVPIDTNVSALEGSFDILSARVGKITQWYPDNVEIEVYNDRKGIHQKILMPKSKVAIIENPLYSIVNAPNSTLQRLIRKLNICDAIDEQSGSGKLDLIIQLPYIIKSDARRAQADKRRKDIEEQLAGSKYGIAYTDGTEKITQLNRSVDNNILTQIQYLTTMLYSQLGITETVLNGTADEKTMMNYINRTVEPIISALTDEFNRKFLTTNARSRGQRIKYFLNPFKLMPLSSMAEIADKLTRNEIMTSNEFRQKLGLKPIDSARANELSNKNLNPVESQKVDSTEPKEENGGNIQNGQNIKEV